jgi:hypothetical protein
VEASSTPFSRRVDRKSRRKNTKRTTPTHPNAKKHSLVPTCPPRASSFAVCTLVVAGELEEFKELTLYRERRVRTKEKTTKRKTYLVSLRGRFRYTTHLAIGGRKGSVGASESAVLDTTSGNKGRVCGKVVVCTRSFLSHTDRPRELDSPAVTSPRPPSAIHLAPTSVARPRGSPSPLSTLRS